MRSVDLNLLIPLDALLAERSVTGAARRLGLSSSAMSRTLARLRAATGDPLLVQAGRSLVATPYAEELGEQVHALARDARALLRPATRGLDLASLDRTFTIRAGAGFVERFAAELAAAFADAAPQARLRFAAKPDKDAAPLRDGAIDLEVGVVGTSAPEMRTQLLFRDRFVGVVRAGHPLLEHERLTAERYAAWNHVVASRKAHFSGPVDDALQQLGLARRVSVVVPGYSDVLRIAGSSDLIGLVPRSCLGNPALTDHRLTDHAAAIGLRSFSLPVDTPQIRISAIWHPRLEADPAHRWLRETVMALCKNALTGRSR